MKSGPGTYWEGVGDVFLGYGDAAVGTLKGLYGTVRHPIQTATGIGHAIGHPINTFHSIKNDLIESAQTNRGMGRLVGNGLIAVATGGALKAVGESATVAKIASKLKRVAPKGIAGKFRRVPNSLREKLAMDEAMGGAGKQGDGRTA